ncbi:hypothetical protein [Gemmata sp.]
MRRAVSLTRNDDGTWTASIYSTTHRGTHEECVAWLRANGEHV